MSQTSVQVDSIPNSSASEEIVAGALNASDVQNGLDAIVKLAQVAGVITGNQAVQKVAETFRAIATQQWFINLIVGVSSLFDKGEHGQATQLIAGSAPEMNHGDEPIVAQALNPVDVSNAIDAIVNLATTVAALTGNVSIVKVVTVVSTVVKEPWFASMVVNLSSFFGK